MNDKHVTQADLARLLGVTPSAVGNALTGDKALLTSTLRNILSTLDLTLTVTTKDPAPNPSETENG